MTVLIISVCLFLLFIMMKRIGNITDPQEPLKLGVVGDINDEFFQIGLAAMKHFDSSRFAVEIIELEEEEAVKMTRDGTLSGYAVIPEGFVRSVMTGENKQITLVTTDSSEDLMTQLVIEFMDQISGYLLETQNSIYGLQRYMTDNSMTDQTGTAINEINLFYVNLVMRRDNLFAPMQFIDTGNTVSSAAGYICGLTVFLVMLFGITYSPVYTHRELSLNAVLRSRGMGLVFQMLCEYLSYLFMMLICIIPLMSGIVYAIHRSGISVAEWEQGYFEDYRFFVLGYIPIVIMFAAAQYMLFMAADNFIAGVSLQFICAVVFAYLGGCLYPLSFFPEIIRKSAMYQPAGLSYRYLADIMLVNDGHGTLLRMLIYTVLFLAAAVIIMDRRLKHEK
ncbi:MAG: ABC transporter permease [Lachnospiraceae bacterium]|nr:ABC transporter permease [Lachnospiraceae bacterium]